MAATPPPEWKRMKDDESGTPVWRHVGEPVQVITWDVRLLEYLDLALVTFNELGGGRLPLPSTRPGPGPECNWTDFRDSA